MFPGIIRLPYYLDEPADGMDGHISETEGDERINDGTPLEDNAPIGSHWS